MALAFQYACQITKSFVMNFNVAFGRPTFHARSQSFIFYVLYISPPLITGVIKDVNNTRSQKFSGQYIWLPAVIAHSLIFQDTSWRVGVCARVCVGTVSKRMREEERAWEMEGGFSWRLSAFWIPRNRILIFWVWLNFTLFAYDGREILAIQRGKGAEIVW